MQLTCPLDSGDISMNASRLLVSAILWHGDTPLIIWIVQKSEASGSPSQLESVERWIKTTTLITLQKIQDGLELISRTPARRHQRV